MKREIFFEYSEWLFTLIEEIQKRIDISNYSTEEGRVIAHIAERLLGVFVTYKKEKFNKSLHTRQWFYIKDTRTTPTLQKLLDNDTAIPILMLCSGYYVPYCTATILSIAKTSNPNRQYDIIIMAETILQSDQKMMKDSVSLFPNVHIRFFDIELYFVALSLPERFDKWACKQVAGTSYNKSLLFRLFSPFILSNYSKYIWLDSDVIVKEDIANLFDTDIHGHVIGAVHDLILCSLLNGADKKAQNFYTKKYRAKNPYEYVNAGVMLLNAEKFRKQYTLEQIVNSFLKEPFFIVEQDTLNLLIEGDVFFLDERWNCFALGGVYPQYMSFAPAKMYKKYLKAREKPGIIHYAGYDKPWNNPFTDFAEEYWNNIRDTPLYELSMYRMIASRVDPLGGAVYDLQLRAGVWDYRSGARKFADKILPLGSLRRKFAKLLLPKGSLRWRFCKQAYYIIKPQYRPAKISDSDEYERENT